MSEYNYSRFPLDMRQEDFRGFADVLKVGKRAPDGGLVDAGDGAPVRLSELWRSGPLVIEFGSIT